MNKQDLALHLTFSDLTYHEIEELLTNFLNSELAQRRPKIDLLGAGIVEPYPSLENFGEIPNAFETQPNETQL